MDFDLLNYDKYIVSFSGGKDSTACLLYLLDNGVPKEKIELWHQEIDGRGPSLFDWEVTPDYCRKLGQAFGIPVLFQWKEGGFTREMLRENSLTAPVHFELPDGTTERVGGERGEESKQRAGYAILEPDKADLRKGRHTFRWIDRFRPVRDWKERQVWDLLEKYRVRPHPCYFMGFGRCSCKFCVFGNKDQFASAACVSRQKANILIAYEKEFGYTLKRDTDLASLIAKGTPYNAITRELAKLATHHEYASPVIVPEGQPWALPDGAFHQCGGPS